jgi:LCP family protein required for cell wall assembly
VKLAFWWVVISLIVFLASAQIHQTSVGGGGLLGGGGFPLTSPNTILVLGSDARPSGSKEAGAGGASRSDTIMLLRVGGGANSKLSIPRDTIAEIPGHGVDKINAAYAYGGAELAVRTVEQYLSVDINHVIEVNFENFPKLIDSMGGITYKGSCVISRINGGFRNGGYTLRLKAGRTHIDGKQALALARTRKNLCNPRENDLARAARQQKILSAMKWRLLTPMAFVRLPWIAWQTPQTMRTDMSGPTQLGMFGGLMIGGGSNTRVLKPTGTATTSSGGAGLVVSPESRQRAVARFMKG